MLGSGGSWIQPVTSIPGFDEGAQDAVGSILVDTATIDFTYTDATPSIIADVIPGGVDHNSLLNFVANKHIDHTAVSITAGTGLSGGGDISATRTINLANTAVTAALYGSATQVSQVTIDAQGRVTLAANVTIQIAESQVTNLVSDLAGKQATGNYITALTGDVTASGPGSVAATLATVASAGTTGSSTSIPSVTINAKGLVTSVTGNAVIAPAGTLTGTVLAANVVTSSLTSVGTITTGVWTGTDIALIDGGTNASLVASNGAVVYSTASALALSGVGSSGQILRSAGAAAPTWSTATYPATAGTSGKILVSDGTNIVSSTPTFPNASATAGKLIVSDGTNWVASTPTYPNASATSGKFIISDGTNFVATTSTIPTSAGATANKVVLSDGTNYVLSTPTFPNASATAGKITISDGTNWVASTPTFPNTATGTGTILRADGTNWAATTATYPATTTVSQILYSSATNVVGGITTANTAALITNSSGVPAFTTGGVANRILRTDGTTITFAQVVLTTDVTGTLPVANGGTNATTTGGAFNSIAAKYVAARVAVRF